RMPRRTRAATYQPSWVRNLHSHPKTISRGLGSYSPKFCLRPNPPELESGLRFYHLAVHLKQRIYQKVDRSAFGFRIDHQIATLGQFEPISWIMTKIIISELWILPRFTDVYRDPLTVCEKFGPAVVAVDFAFILVGWNGRTNSETRGYVEASRQSDEIGMKIAAISGARVACVHGVSAAPTSA